jgi:hypothetical protein
LPELAPTAVQPFGEAHDTLLSELGDPVGRGSRCTLQSRPFQSSAIGRISFGGVPVPATDGPNDAPTAMHSVDAGHEIESSSLRLNPRKAIGELRAQTPPA